MPRAPRRASRRALAAAMAAPLLLTAADAAAASSKFALGMLHFNIQYVAGGLTGFLAIPNPVTDLNAEQVEDAIVEESFEPVLDLFAAHPTWGVDIELQGYMLDVLAARHPAVLDKLRALALSGQIEVVSFHYSDQLFIAHPREDWARSQVLDQKTFDTHGVPRGAAVFCQEGQAGPGMAGAMSSAGYKTLVFPKNLFSYQHGDAMQPAPLYRFGDIQMVTSRDITFDDGKNQIQTSWWFVDDGELFATNSFDPYIIDKFKTDPASIAKHEQELMDLESKGFSITTVSKYVEAIKPLVQPADPPPLLDGTWQPNTTDGIHRWLGGFGVWWKDERDNDVRTLGAMAHRELLAAEVIAAQAGIDATEEVAAGFRLLALGEVSDATGINPFRGEVEYGIGHFTEALRIARDVINRSKAALGATAVSIDVDKHVVEKGATFPAPAAETDPVLPLTIQSGDRQATTTWRKLAEGRSEVSVHFTAGDERVLSVTFPGTPGDIVYTPALLDAPVHVPRDAFVFDHFELALSDGLIGLGNAGKGSFVIKDQATVHVSATITPGSGDVVFHDDTAPSGEEVTWVFQVVDGSETDAAAAARALNVNPEVWR